MGKREGNGDDGMMMIGTSSLAASTESRSSKSVELLLGLDATPGEALEQYKRLLKQTEPEREAYLAALHDLSLSHQETYWLEYNIGFLESELKRIDDERNRIDRRVKAQVRQSVGIKDHIQRLEEQNAEDRMRIQRLIALSQPVTSDITILLPKGNEEAKASKTRPEEGGVETKKEEEVREGEGGNYLNTSWVKKALEVESDANVVALLKSIQQLEKDIEKAKEGYELEVVELQRQRSLREVEAAKAIHPIMRRLEASAKKLQENEVHLKETLKAYLQLIHDAQVHKREALDEHAALALLRKQVSEEVKAFKADLRRQAKEIMSTAETEAEANTGKLQEQLTLLEEQICLIVEQYRDQKPVIERRLSSLSETLTKTDAALKKETERYKLDSEGYEADVRALSVASQRARRMEERLAATSNVSATARRLLQSSSGGGAAGFTSSSSFSKEGGGRGSPSLGGLEEMMEKLEMNTKGRRKGVSSSSGSGKNERRAVGGGGAGNRGR